MPRLISTCGMSVPGDAFSKLNPIPFSSPADTDGIGPRNSVKATIWATAAHQLKHRLFRIRVVPFAGDPIYPALDSIPRPSDRTMNISPIAKGLGMTPPFEFSTNLMGMVGTQR